MDTHERESQRLFRAAIVVCGLACFVGTSGATDETADDLLRWVVEHQEKSERVTWYEPEQDYITSCDFKAFPAISKGDDGQKSLVLRAVRKSNKGIGLKSLEVRVDGATSTIPIKQHDVNIDRHGCRVVEKVTLENEEALVRSIAAAKEVEVVVTGVLSTDTYRLADQDLDDFQRIVKLYDRPDPPKKDPEPVAEVSSVINPELILSTKVQPVFPRQARLDIVRGSVIIQAIIRKDGTVGDVKVLSSTACDCGFEAAAMSAVMQWRYKPGMQAGHPVDVYFTVVVDFKFQ